MALGLYQASSHLVVNGTNNKTPCFSIFRGQQGVLGFSGNRGDSDDGDVCDGNDVGDPARLSQQPALMPAMQMH
jgi:hypothetical protein